ncbi:MAG: DUF2975 domain-containing protein [Oscillospiraceae bacterium]|nr:DUF2975 domain-containing protein [Oscillospiraceae bacterium]
MKVKKRYYVACVLMCIMALLLGVSMFYFEMGLARYSKLNKAVRTTWIETSASDPETGLNTDLFITNVHEVDEVTERNDGQPVGANWSYIGQQIKVDGKYTAYGKEVYGNNIILNGDVKRFDKISVYYKPDNPLMVYYPVSYTLYFIVIGAAFVVAIVLIIICRLLNNSLKNNTFSDKAVTFMDIPLAVIIVCVVIGFFAGMFIGNIQVDSSYTTISEGLAEMYKNHELQF